MFDKKMKSTKRMVLVEFPDLSRRWRTVYLGKDSKQFVKYNNQHYFITQIENNLYRLTDYDNSIFYLRNPTAFKL